MANDTTMHICRTDQFTKEVYTIFIFDNYLTGIVSVQSETKTAMIE